MRSLTVGALRELIKDLPDSTPVLAPAPDHSYRECEANVTTAGKTEGRRGVDYWMWYGQNNACDGEVPIEVLVIQ